MNQNKQKQSGINVGTSLVLVAFVLLCLVAFAALSFSSAKSDESLTIQVAERQKLYYSATSNAESTMAKLNQTLKEISNEALSEEDFYKALSNASFDSNVSLETIDGKMQIKIHAAMDDAEEVLVTLSPLYIPQDGAYFEILSYRTYRTEEWEDPSEGIIGINNLFD